MFIFILTTHGPKNSFHKKHYIFIGNTWKANIFLRITILLNRDKMYNYTKYICFITLLIKLVQLCDIAIRHIIKIISIFNFLKTSFFLNLRPLDIAWKTLGIFIYLMENVVSKKIFQFTNYRKYGEIIVCSDNYS